MSDQAPPRADGERADLDRIERELRDVETTLARLADGTYWTEPGAPVPGTAAPGAHTPDR